MVNNYPTNFKARASHLALFPSGSTFSSLLSEGIKAGVVSFPEVGENGGWLACMRKRDNMMTKRYGEIRRRPRDQIRDEEGEDSGCGWVGFTGPRIGRKARTVVPLSGSCPLKFFQS